MFLNGPRAMLARLATQTMDFSPDEARPSDFGLMPKPAADWDTLGWIAFRKGDTAAAEKYLEVALGATAPPPGAAVRQKISEEMKRLRPLLTSSSSGSSSRIRAQAPDAHVALADMRSLNIPFPMKLRGESARANFVISITNGSKADNVAFLSGRLF